MQAPLRYGSRAQIEEVSIVGNSQIPLDLLDQVGDLVRTVVEEIWEAFPGYDADQLRRREVEQLAAYHLKLALRAVADTRVLDDDDLVRTRRLGSSRALQGVPIQSVIWGFRIGERVLINAFLSHAKEGDIEAVRDGLQRLGQVFDTLTDAATSAYHDTQHEITVHYERLQTDLVDELVASPEEALPGFRDRAKLVGADPDLAFQAVGLGVPECAYPESMLGVRRHFLSAIGSAAQDHLLSGSSGGHLLILVPWSEDEDTLVEILKRTLRGLGLRVEPVVGVGERSRRLAEVGRSCRQALQAVDVGLSLHRRGCVVRYDDVIPEALFVGDPQARGRLMHSRLDPVLGRRHLVITLETYLACDGNQRQTARALRVHPNTVAYRLRQIEELLGRSLGCTEAKVDLSLALRALKLDETLALDDLVH